MTSNGSCCQIFSCFRLSSYAAVIAGVDIATRPAFLQRCLILSAHSLSCLGSTVLLYLVSRASKTGKSAPGLAFGDVKLGIALGLTPWLMAASIFGAFSRKFHRRATASSCARHQKNRDDQPNPTRTTVDCWFFHRFVLRLAVYRRLSGNKCQAI